MLLEFQKHIAANFNFLKEKKLLIAISGGLDSVVLTYLLHQLKYNITLAHCNFRLRGKASDLDEIFVKNLAKNLNCHCFTISFDTKEYAQKNKLSIQMAAREMRYRWFDKILLDYNYDYLLTAHHADDNLETFLINLSRGTGIEGLTGIPTINKNTVRPLLSFSREKIKHFAITNNITWREDQSNAQTKYLRNKIRHDIIPLLKEVQPNLLKSFTKTINHLQDSNQIIKDRIEEIEKQVIIEEKDVLNLNIDVLKTLSKPKAYLFELLRKYGFSEWDDIENLLDAQTGKQIYSKTHHLIRDRDFLILRKIVDKNKKKLTFEINKTDKILQLKELSLKFSNSRDTKILSKEFLKENKQFIYLDKSLLRFPLTVRKWQNSDYFYPFGMQGKKKLSKYFKDQKLSLIDKENIWLLCSENDIVWVINHRMDERFKVKKSTKKIFKIEIIQ